MDSANLSRSARCVPNRRGRGLAIVSLVCGMISLPGITAPVAVPAIITGLVALARKTAARGLAVTGIVTGVAGMLVFVLAVMPGYRELQEQSRQAMVRANMVVIRDAIEDYAIDRFGNYPDESAFFDSADSCAPVRHYLPGGRPGRAGREEEPVCGDYPVNPYTGERYHYGRDLFLLRLLCFHGHNRADRSDDENCPFVSLVAPEGYGGTIVILGYGAELVPGIIEYTIAAYGRDRSEPMAECCPRNKDVRVFCTLHN